ncbi:hypothetical protein [Nocardioides sp. R-C-SC26]|uniref:hypothetical protein n=1 Tax=Nocardioides sp. R-C-SC26 TaxID=2870414 RepID=UPI001E484E7F|nr:hypothetical protein [Nocardioides sp. R-C-SC26]
MIFQVPVDSFHDAHLDLASGLGLVVLPAPMDDVFLSGSSLHGAAWEYAVGMLRRMGWTPRLDPSAGLRYVGVAAGARPVVEVEAEQALVTTAASQAWRDLREAAGV